MKEKNDRKPSGEKQQPLEQLNEKQLEEVRGGRWSGNVNVEKSRKKLALVDRRDETYNQA